MKQLLSILICSVLMLVSSNVQSQSEGNDRFYNTAYSELIFSVPDVKVNDKQLSGPVRFSAFFHFSVNQHADFSNTVGIFSGLGVRNIGFIVDRDSLRTKFRSYTLGIPLALKIGNLKDDTYFYLGGEIEYLFNYKQKDFIDGNKTKVTEWFSNRTEQFLPSAFVGLNMKQGGNIRFTYTLGDFLNKDFTLSNGTKPYSNMKSNFYMISIASNVRYKKMINPRSY